MFKFFLLIIFLVLFLGFFSINSYAQISTQNFCGDYCGLGGGSTCKQFYLGSGNNGTSTMYVSYCLPIDDNRILAYNQQCPAGQIIDKCDNLDPFHAQCSNTYPAQLCTCKPAPPPPVCNAPCITSSQCPLDCPVCTPVGEIGGKTCQTAPTATPTPTVIVPTSTPTPTNPPTFCNESCNDDSDCALATDSCIVCLPDPTDSTKKTCQVPPAATPTPTVTPTASATPSPTVTGTPIPTATPTPTPSPSPTGIPTSTPTRTPTATPTPDPFNEAMCKCDGIEYTALLSGQNVTVTAFGKVEGSDTSYAQIPYMDFTFMKSSGNSPLAERIGPERLSTTIESQSSAKVRYKAVWNFTVPSNVNSSETYRLQAQLRCSKKITAIPMDRVVLAESTENRGFFGQVSDFVLGLFGIRRPNVTISNEPTVKTQNDRENNLKLGNFSPGVAEDTDNCSFVRFKFGQSQSSGY